MRASIETSKHILHQVNTTTRTQLVQNYRIIKFLTKYCRHSNCCKLREKKSHDNLSGLILRFKAHSDVFISYNERESEGIFLFRKFDIFKRLYGVCKIFFGIRFKMPL